MLSISNRRCTHVTPLKFGSFACFATTPPHGSKGVNSQQILRKRIGSLVPQSARFFGKVGQGSVKVSTMLFCSFLHAHPYLASMLFLIFDIKQKLVALRHVGALLRLPDNLIACLCKRLNKVIATRILITLIAATAACTTVLRRLLSPLERDHLITD